MHEAITWQQIYMFRVVHHKYCCNWRLRWQRAPYLTTAVETEGRNVFWHASTLFRPGCCLWLLCVCLFRCMCQHPSHDGLISSECDGCCWCCFDYARYAALPQPSHPFISVYFSKTVKERLHCQLLFYPCTISQRPLQACNLVSLFCYIQWMCRQLCEKAS